MHPVGEKRRVSLIVKPDPNCVVVTADELELDVLPVPVVLPDPTLLPEPDPLEAPVPLEDVPKPLELALNKLDVEVTSISGPLARTTPTNVVAVAPAPKASVSEIVIEQSGLTAYVPTWIPAPSVLDDAASIFPAPSKKRRPERANWLVPEIPPKSCPTSVLLKALLDVVPALLALPVPDVVPVPDVPPAPVVVPVPEALVVVVVIGISATYP